MYIAQITDTHIVKKGEFWHNLPIIRNDERLKRVVSYITNMAIKPDIVVFTGDLIDGNEEAYLYFKEIVSQLTMPVYLVPGNHDHIDLFRTAFQDHAYLPTHGQVNYVIDDYPTKLIMLDTTSSGESKGYISFDQVNWLRLALQQEPTIPTIIFMHHYPIIMGGPYDKYRCFVDDSFPELIKEYSNILLMAAGHAHNPFVTNYAGKLFIISPSVAPTFHFKHPLDINSAGIELEEPAFTLHHFHNDQIISKFIYVKSAPNQVISNNDYNKVYYYLK